MSFEAHLDGLVAAAGALPDEERIGALNTIRERLRSVSPFRQEPVDCVLWVPSDTVVANDYNPNTVAPPEMVLLAHSIRADGFTQPIVAFRRSDGVHEVVDGFHRNRVGREVDDVRERLHGRLPVAVINPDRTETKDRMAATVRHNRARGVHSVRPMAALVAQLYFDGWSNKRIAAELGMDPDEVLRLKQVTGIATLFENREFSSAWELEERLETSKE